MQLTKAAARTILLSTLVLMVGKAEARSLPAGGTGNAVAAAAESYPGACSVWTKVNDDAFGLPGALDAQGRPASPPPLEPYRGQEGFELQIFNGQLYLGMEADNQLGARIWRTRPGVAGPWRQSDWQEVAADGEGNPFGSPNVAQHDHIDSLEAFQGQLYASVANRGAEGGGFRLYRSATGNPGTWQEANETAGPGFGDPDNENLKDMQVYEGQLCGGTWNERTGAQVWCTPDGETWRQVNRGGFAAVGADPRRIAVWSGHVFNETLYFGVQNKGEDLEDSRDDRAELYRTSRVTEDPAWQLVFEGEPGSFRADLLGNLNGWLYLAAGSPAGMVVYRSRSGDSGTWQPASPPGMNGNPYNLGTVVDGAAVYNGALYVSVSNTRSGLTLWRTSGRSQTGEQPIAWERVSESGLGDPANNAAELVVFNGSLYAWTSNYRQGHQVYRSACPICQRQEISSPGRYLFDDLGLEIVFHSENLTSLEACFYPEALPHGAPEHAAAPGYLVFRPVPAVGTFNAALSLTLGTETPEGTGAKTPGPMAFWHWNGHRWQPCKTPLASTPDQTGVRCDGVSDFDFPWLVLPVGTLPGPSRTPGAWAGALGAGILFMLILVFRRQARDQRAPPAGSKWPKSGV